jgi:hypothetical protein
VPVPVGIWAPRTVLPSRGEYLALLTRRDTLGRRPVGELGQNPGPHRGLDRGRVEVLHDPADGRGVRHDRADTERVEDRAGGVVGELGDRGERARPGQYRARPQQQDREHVVAYPPGLARVGNLAQRVDQGQRRSWGGLAVESDLRVIEGGNDRDTCSAGTGFLT